MRPSCYTAKVCRHLPWISQYRDELALTGTPELQADEVVMQVGSKRLHAAVWALGGTSQVRSSLAAFAHISLIALPAHVTISGLCGLAMHRPDRQRRSCDVAASREAPSHQHFPGDLPDSPAGDGCTSTMIASPQ